MRRGAIVQMVVVGVVASALGIALGLAIDWFPTAAATQADSIDTLYDVMIIATVPIFVLVCVVVIFSVINFRMRPGQEDDDGPPIHGNTKLEIVWTAIPTVMIVALCAYAYVVLRDIEREPAQAAQEMKVGVVGEQFAWTFTYPKSMTGGKQLTTTDLVLPKGRSVQFQIKAKDVLHDFWVPAFRIKIDAVPGITTRYRVTPSRTGDFPVVCAELCGLGHSVMRTKVRVLEADKFAAWIKKESAPAAAPPANASPAQLAAAGKKVFLGGPACGSCHKLDDAGSNGQIGPALDASLKSRDAAYIKQAIVAPDSQLAAGYGKGIMPGNYRQTLSATEIDALVAYLKEATSK